MHLTSMALAPKSQTVRFQGKGDELPSFSVSDKKTWRGLVKKNTDMYGRGTLQYAAKWANLMEQELAKGRPIHEIAKDTSHTANTEGISGFMYGMAVKILSQVWTHGEALRQWSNKDLQINDEGDKANREGGVLNPAVVCFNVDS